MNKLLQLKGQFQQKSKEPQFGSPKLPPGGSVNVTHLKNLQKNLEDLDEFWSDKKIVNGALVSIYYNDIIAKSNRCKGYFSVGSKTADSSIVGARFTDDGTKHIITHYVDKHVIKETIQRVKNIISILQDQFNSICNEDDVSRIGMKDFDFQRISSRYNVQKTIFLRMIVDSNHIEKISVYENIKDITDNSIVTLYSTDSTAKQIMEKLGINLFSSKIIDDTTVLLNEGEFSILKEKAPYLVSMLVEDLSELALEDFSFDSEVKITIPDPASEPTIGVIDTMFDEKVYFSKWVKFTKMIDDEIPLSKEDYNHGTAISSIIVDGPSFNPKMNDGCGRFKVRHFGVATKKQFSSFSVMKSIEEIVKKNTDIKVWNLSLGSKLEINKNFISPEAAILDRIQYDNDVIFVIAGTNDNEKTFKKRIGAPADSLNSIVVNSVNFAKKPASYSRSGIVLSFFNKPDVSYYGGDDKETITVCEPLGKAAVLGTSFAAPWIARKTAYLINVLGLTREIAKALIIDSSTNWQRVEDNNKTSLIGFGVVPTHIRDVVETKTDEIKFVISGTSEKYDTYTYNLPVPVIDSKHPFIAKATLCYFPNSSRNQGVDYTNTELDIYFGRIANGEIKSINRNTQAIEGQQHTFERTARKFWRKWDNTKHIRDFYNNKVRSKKAYNNNLWGISIKTKQRLEKKDEKALNFGIVITLKEIKGVNRIDEFIQLCMFRGWLVDKIDIDNRIDVYTKLHENVKFE